MQVRKQQNTRKIKASVDVDTCLKQSYPRDHRWDYVICYEDSKAILFCVEVHPMKKNSRENVKELIEKKKWLVPLISSLSLKKYFIWIPTKEVCFLRGSVAKRMLSTSGIIISNIIFLDSEEYQK